MANRTWKIIFGDFVLHFQKGPVPESFRKKRPQVTTSRFPCHIRRSSIRCLSLREQYRRAYRKLSAFFHLTKAFLTGQNPPVLYDPENVCQIFVTFFSNFFQIFFNFFSIFFQIFFKFFSNFFQIFLKLPGHQGEHFPVLNHFKPKIRLDCFT